MTITLNPSKKFFINKKPRTPFNWIFFIIITIFFILFLIALCIYFLINFAPSRNRNKGVIVTNGLECSKIGKEIFEKGGNVADVAVTTVLCEGIQSPQSCGIGGGFLLTIYFREAQKFYTLNAREVAPKLATWDMFKDDPKLSESGALSVAVPGEIKGLWELHKAFGKLAWKDLLKPVIELCKNGSLVTTYLENMFKITENQIKEEKSLSEIFINPKTGRTFKQGDKIQRLKLAETLEVIAEEGASALYGGEIGKKLVEDLKARGGIISEEDLKEFKVRWSTPITSSILDNLTFHSMPLPSSSAIIHLMLNILSGYDLNFDSLTIHRIVESMKFGYAKRTFLGDEETPDVFEMIKNLTDKSYANHIRTLISDTQTFNNLSYYGPNLIASEDHGTAHISILAPNGDAVSVTSTINYRFGAFLASEQTGIILNNEMDDFSNPGATNIYEIPPSPQNMIRPGKNPLSSMSPSIITDKNGDVKLVIGASGGSRIITGVFNSLFNHLYFNNSLTNAVEARRLHHQLVPPQLQYETNFNAEFLKDLSEKFGHELLEDEPDGGFAAVTGISLINGEVDASFDSRRGGSIEIF